MYIFNPGGITDVAWGHSVSLKRLTLDVACGRLIVVSAVVSDWRCCRAGVVESSSAVVAGKVVPNRRGTHRWLYHTLGYRGGGSAYHGTCAEIPRGPQ